MTSQNAFVKGSTQSWPQFGDPEYGTFRTTIWLGSERSDNAPTRSVTVCLILKSFL
jgi:hypothetical protein